MKNADQKTVMPLSGGKTFEVDGPDFEQDVTSAHSPLLTKHHQGTITNDLRPKYCFKGAWLRTEPYAVVDQVLVETGEARLLVSGPMDTSGAESCITSLVDVSSEPSILVVRLFLKVAEAKTLPFPEIQTRRWKAEAAPLQAELSKLKSIDCSKVKGDGVSQAIVALLDASTDLDAGVGEILNESTPWHTTRRCVESIAKATEKLEAKLKLIQSGNSTLACSGSEYVPVFQTEIYWSQLYFQSVEYGRSVSLRNPAWSEPSYIRVTGFPHGVEYDGSWSLKSGDLLGPTRTVAKFGAVVAAMAASRSAAIPAQDESEKWVAAGSTTKSAKLSEPIILAHATDCQNVLAQIPPLLSTGTKFFGPIPPSNTAAYKLELNESSRPGGPKGAAMAFEYWPNQEPYVSLDVGMQADFVSFNTEGQADGAAFNQHEWRASAVPESGATRYQLTEEPVTSRRFSPYIGLMVSPPGMRWRWMNLFFHHTVNLPIGQSRGVSQIGVLGFGVRFFFGLSISAMFSVREVNRLVTDVAAGQHVLISAGAAPPTLEYRPDWVGLLGMNIGFDLGLLGKAIVEGFKPAFEGGKK